MALIINSDCLSPGVAIAPPRMHIYRINFRGASSCSILVSETSWMQPHGVFDDSAALFWSVGLGHPSRIISRREEGIPYPPDEISS
jgi:hypothetical protein